MEIKKLIDPEHIIRITKEIELLKIIILKGHNYQLFSQLIENKHSGRFLLFNTSVLQKVIIKEAGEFNEIINKNLLKILEYLN